MVAAALQRRRPPRRARALSPRARLVLVCGLPGAGKTTLARTLAADLDAVRLCADEWMPDVFDSVVREHLDAQFWALAQDLLRRGVTVVLESGFWTRRERDEKREAARGLGVAVDLYVIDAPVEELWGRVEARNRSAAWRGRPITQNELEEWSTWFERPDDAERALFDEGSS